MRFQFYNSDTNLTKTLQMDGCGLTAVQTALVTVWQGNSKYEFSFHTGYHGKGAQHYVYIREAGSSQVTGCSRVRIADGAVTNDGKLKNALTSDASAVVNANRALFLLMAQGYSGQA